MDYAVLVAVSCTYPAANETVKWRFRSSLSVFLRMACNKPIPFILPAYNEFSG